MEARSAADDRGRGLSLIMRDHLCHIYGVSGDNDVPSFRRETALARTNSKGLALLSQFFLTGMSAFLSEFHRHADLLNISLPLFNFFTRGAFTNHSNHPAGLSGGISGWTSIQSLGGRGAAVASNLADIGAQDSRFVNADNLACGKRSPCR